MALRLWSRNMHTWNAVRYSHLSCTTYGRRRRKRIRAVSLGTWDCWSGSLGCSQFVYSHFGVEGCDSTAGFAVVSPVLFHFSSCLYYLLSHDVHRDQYVSGFHSEFLR